MIIHDDDLTWVPRPDLVTMTGLITRWRSINDGGLIDFINDQGDLLKLNGTFTHWNSYEALVGKTVKVWLKKPIGPGDKSTLWYQILFVQLLILAPPLTDQDFRRIADILKGETA